jgi:hypothetical protein
LSSVKNTKISAATIQEEQLQLTEELREMESEYATEYISHWWKLEREKHTYTILVVYRGSWCAFCRGWLKRWNKVGIPFLQSHVVFLGNFNEYLLFFLH